MMFVSEVSSTHNRNLERSFAFIDAAAGIGCDAVKFQLFRVDELFAPQVLEQSEEHRRRAAWELPLEFLPKLAAHCRTRGIQFGCTPFYLDAVAELEPHVDFFKIASYELLWDDLLATCARTGKPLQLSTGMATLAEVEAAVGTFRRAGGSDLTLLHCVSDYPTAVEDANLAAIAVMREAFDTPVGWSDHSVSPLVLRRAIHKWDAAVIEFHLDLDGSGDEYQAGHCWLPDEIGSIINELQSGNLVDDLQSSPADGDGIKAPRDKELHERQWRADPSDGLRPLVEIRGNWMA